VLLTKTHLRARFRYDDNDVRTFIANLAVLAIVTAEDTEVPRVVRDPEDDMVIACAVAAGAEYLVTRDHDLLSLERHAGTIEPEEFLGVLRAAG
jgi:putative PIN family toxin of toxin-antitoxin system